VPPAEPIVIPTKAPDARKNDVPARFMCGSSSQTCDTIPEGAYRDDDVARADLNNDKSIASPIALYPASLGCR